MLQILDIIMGTVFHAWGFEVKGNGLLGVCIIESSRAELNLFVIRFQALHNS